MVPVRLSVLCELRSKGVMYLRLVIVCAVRDVGRARAALCIKFCVKLGRNGVETFEMLRTAFSEQCLRRASIFEWHKKFKEGRGSVDDNLWSGRPTTSKTDDCVARVRELIRANRRLTSREFSVEVGVSYGTCQATLAQDLNMRRVAAKFVLRILTAEQTCCRKQRQMKTLLGKSSRATRRGSTGMTRR